MEKRKFVQYQQQIKRWFNRTKARCEEFRLGDLVLKWDKLHEDKGSHTKFQRLWLGPFKIAEKMGQGTSQLQTLEGELENHPTNGLIFKRYFT